MDDPSLIELVFYFQKFCSKRSWSGSTRLIELSKSSGSPADIFLSKPTSFIITNKNVPLTFKSLFHLRDVYSNLLVLRVEPEGLLAAKVLTRSYS